ncbi:biotin transporter BioY [Lacrimispora sp. JR3]|uniref:biotin transporter BioY n=1 Tax=Lacrimispora sinapis TaxID=3111456 RepID=UPI003747DF5E
MKITAKELTLCASFAALSAILSQIAIPIGPVPINLAHISVFTAAGLLGARYGALSQFVFVLMGAVGLPVFSGFNGGLFSVIGPTGGYIIAYIASAFLAGLIIERSGKSTVPVLAAAIYTGWIVTYLFGTLWYCYITHTGFAAALMVCVIPFLPGDFFKTCFSIYLIKKLNPVLSMSVR